MVPSQSMCAEWRYNSREAEFANFRICISKLHCKYANSQLSNLYLLQESTCSMLKEQKIQLDINSHVVSTFVLTTCIILRIRTRV